MSGVPKLERGCGSWIGTSPRGTVVETTIHASAQKMIDAGWKVETAGQYLGRINREIRERGK